MRVGVERFLAGVVATTLVLGIAAALTIGGSASASGVAEAASAEAIDRPLPPEFTPYVHQAAACPGLDPLLLVAIHDVETRRDPVGSTSSAGALGPMQFLPTTWSAYGVDANGDGTASPYDLDDALASAAGYLCDHGVLNPPTREMAIWNYNHSWTYVRAVNERYEQLRRTY